MVRQGALLIQTCEARALYLRLGIEITHLVLTNEAFLLQVRPCVEDRDLDDRGRQEQIAVLAKNPGSAARPVVERVLAAESLEGLIDEWFDRKCLVGGNSHLNIVAQCWNLDAIMLLQWNGPKW